MRNAGFMVVKPHPVAMIQTPSGVYIRRMRVHVCCLYVLLTLLFCSVTVHELHSMKWYNVLHFCPEYRLTSACASVLRILPFKHELRTIPSHDYRRWTSLVAISKCTRYMYRRKFVQHRFTLCISIENITGGHADAIAYDQPSYITMYSQTCQHMNLIDHEKGGHAQSRHEFRHNYTIACHILSYKHAHITAHARACNQESMSVFLCSRMYLHTCVSIRRQTSILVHIPHSILEFQASACGLLPRD